jgi:adenylate cyclase
VTCVSCGLEISAGFAFCPHCGHRQPSPAASATSAKPKPLPAEADRRQVTVLFADLCGFTSLSERLDPENVRAFQATLFDSLGQSVARYGGFVAKFLGDAVLALFGAPVAHENDPQRALEAALDMLARASDLGRTWEARLGQPVSLHIAVHTGPVVAGQLGDGASATYDVTGDTVNTASRLLGAAAPGTILVGDLTHALARHGFAFESAGEVVLRGKAEPMAVHRLLGVLAAPQSARGLAAHGLVAPMVGRAAELEQLLAAFHGMMHGCAQAVSLSGEAGTGKSRLLTELLERLAQEGSSAGITVRRVACSSLGEPTYGLFAALFRESYGVAPDDSLDAARQKLIHGLSALGADKEIAQAIAPLLSYVLGLGTNDARDVDPEQLKRQIMLAGRSLIERRLEQGPLMIIVDDVHWADTASLDLLRDIADHLSRRPLMMVFAHRPDGLLPDFPCVVQTSIRLGSLSSSETMTLLDGLFGAPKEPAFARVRDLVVGRSGGNPLFVEEIVRSLVASGALVRDGDRWVCLGSGDAVDVPPTLGALLLSRIDMLEIQARRALQAAAVLGINFDEALLHSLVPDVDASIGQLVEVDFVREVGRGPAGRRYRFTHALAQEVAYENLLLSRRGELHERAARALEQAAGPSPSRLSDLEALGHHWSFTSDKARAAHYLVAAGDRARAVYANGDAIHHFERALRVLEDCAQCAEETRLVRERLGDLYALTGRQADALAHYESVRDDFEVAGGRAGAARLYRKIGGLHWEAGAREQAKACFDAGIERLGEHDHPIERAQLYQEIGRLAFRAGDNATAVLWAERALGEAAKGNGSSDEPLQDRALTEAQSYNTLGVALARIGHVQEAVDKIEESIRLAESHDLLQATCRAYTNLSVLYSSLNPRRSIETCLKGLEIAKKVGDLGFQSRLYANLAVAYCALTDRCEIEGIEAAEKAIDLDRRLGLIDHLAVPLIVLGQIRQCHGDPAPALACYEEALALAERVGEPQLLFPCYDGLATLHLDAGNSQMAEHYLAKAQEVCDRAGVEPDALMVLPFLC